MEIRTRTDWTFALSNASTSELVHLATVNAEGTILGDAAWAVLTSRMRVREAHALIAAEQAAREQEKWEMQIERAAAAALAA